MELTREQLKMIADKSNELDLGQLDKYILCDAACCDVFDGIYGVYVTKALQEAYDSVKPGDDGCSGRTDARTWSTIMVQALKELLENPRTEQQKEIDSWIADNISTGALDRLIMEHLKHYPGFKEFYELDVIKAIETVYNEITPEEQYDPYIWTVIVEKTLAILEPNKDKLFKIEFKDEFDGYIKEMIIGHKWIEYNLLKSMEKICFSLSANTHIDTCIDFEDDESVPCIITRIK